MSCVDSVGWSLLENIIVRTIGAVTEFIIGAVVDPFEDVEICSPGVDKVGAFRRQY